MNYKFQLRLRSIHLFTCTVSTCSIRIKPYKGATQVKLRKEQMSGSKN